MLNQYVIDFDKVESIDDIKVILKSLQLGFERPSEELKKLCVFVDKQTGLPVINNN